MHSPDAARTLGVVVLHKAEHPPENLPAVLNLRDQVDELLLVWNGAPGITSTGTRWISFEVNRGTAAAWNAALSFAVDHGYEYVYLLDQDSVPSGSAVATALAEVDAKGAAAVVQPARRDRLRLDPFPWNAVASGSLLETDALRRIGGFDERLFVDEVDHEALARLLWAGYEVTALSRATITHETGSPRPIRFFGARAVVSGHTVQRRRLQGFSGGLLARRHLVSTPSLAARLLLRHIVNAAKDLVAGERAGCRALLSGLVSGAATVDPPARAATRACPYCDGPLLGRFAGVPDWRFRTGPPADVYWCADCGALAAGRAPSDEDMASWYAGYYTHSYEPPPTRLWSSFWPTGHRQQELERLRWYLTPRGTQGRFLDVGTGAGERLLQFADAGWEVVGQDVDREAGAMARSHGIEVHQCAVKELVGVEEPFDLIGINHVLEHVVDPAELLRACAALLAPSGRVCIIAPNARALGRVLFGKWWFGLEQPRHLGIPTLESLERAVADLPLRVLHAETTAANAAVILGGSLARPMGRLPGEGLRRGAAFAMHVLGQALGRAAVEFDTRRGEELVWAGQKVEP